MNLSLILFVAASVQLVLCVSHAWAVVRERGLLTALTLLTVGLPSCGFQQYTKPDGSKISNVTGLSKTTLEVRADGSVHMTANAEKATEELGRYGAGIIKAGLINTGVNALKSVGNNAIKAVQ